MVRLCHPGLPGRVIEVPAEGVPFRRAAGWTFAPPPEPEDPADGPEDDPEDAPGDEPGDEKAAPRRRRRTKEE